MANVVVDLLNTRDVAAGTDSLTGAWLVTNGLAADTEDVDVEAVRAFRERLREALAGEPVSLAGTVTVNVGPSGMLLDGAGPVERVLALLASGGSWDRLKVCRADDCRWAFYDASRNHSRTWCSMSDCGNRAKARAYRARQSPNAGA
jgi:predicted RNA-binding Zn ribbon-like protein